MLLAQVYVMGPITVLVRRPSLRLPVAEGDLEEQVGGLQSVGRVSAYYSESEFGSAPQGDPPHWAIQVLPLPPPPRPLNHNHSFALLPYRFLDFHSF